MSERVATVRFEVPFHDVDALRIVWHGHYLKYFEIARSALFRQAGLDTADLEHRGIWFVVTESRCRHTRPLRLGDHVSVEARFLPNQPRPIVVYRVRNETRGEICARGRTDLAAVDAVTGTLIDTPSDILEKTHG